MNKHPLVAMFFPSLMPGGVQRVMLNLAYGLHQRGIRVDMVLVQAHGHLLSQVPDGVRVIGLNGSRTLASLPQLIRYLNRERPNVLLSAQTHCNLVAIWARALSFVRVRLIASEHGMITSAVNSIQHPVEKYLPFLVSLFYRFADGVLAVSGQTADAVAQTSSLPRGTISVIHNPVIPKDLTNLLKPVPEHPWFRSEEKTIVLAVGQLKEAKDYPTLLRAIARLNVRRRVCLLILGEGDQRDQLESLAISLGIADEVSMPGYVDNPYQYMSRCAVFALSSLWEGFGNVLVEALACGAQVVSTRCPGGPVEILADGKYGRLVPPEDPASMASAIESALDNPIPREILIKRSNDFSIDTILPQYYDLLFPEERH